MEGQCCCLLLKSDEGIVYMSTIDIHGPDDNKTTSRRLLIRSYPWMEERNTPTLFEAGRLNPHAFELDTCDALRVRRQRGNPGMPGQSGASRECPSIYLRSVRHDKPELHHGGAWRGQGKLWLLDPCAMYVLCRGLMLPLVPVLHSRFPQEQFRMVVP